MIWTFKFVCLCFQSPFSIPQIYLMVLITINPSVCNIFIDWEGHGLKQHITDRSVDVKEAPNRMHIKKVFTIPISPWTGNRVISVMHE